MTGSTVLLFMDDQGQIDKVDAETLAKIIYEYDLRLVFLNACKSGEASTLDVAQGFAAMQRAADYFSGILERYPDQWYNFFRYWREEP